MAKKGLFERFKALFIRYDIIPPDADDLTAAILTGNEEEAKRILDQGQDPDQPDDLGRLPLHFAAIKNRPAIISIMIKKGADLHLLDENGNTALMAGAMADAPEASRRLLDEGIDYFLQNNKEKTALDLATEAGNADIVILFKQKLKELELIITKKRQEQGARYSNLSNKELGVEDAGAGGRVQKPDTSRKKKKQQPPAKKTLPQLELEYARLLKLLFP